MCVYVYVCVCTLGCVSVSSNYSDVRSCVCVYTLVCVCVHWGVCVCVYGGVCLCPVIIPMQGRPQSVI